MNKFSSIIRLCTFVGVLSGGFVTEAIKADAVVTAPAIMVLTEEQTRYLDNMVNKIELHVVRATQWAEEFLNPQNNESYVAHANRYKDAYAAFTEDVINPLRTAKQVADVSLYGQLISELNAIVAKVDEPAKYILATLEKHRKNTNPTMLGMDLSKAEKYTEPAFISPLQTQLKSVQAIFSKIYQSLVKKIDVIINSLEQRKTKKRSSFESWKVLKHRVSCK